MGQFPSVLALAAALLLGGALIPERAGRALANEPEMPPYPERGLKGPVSADRLPVPENEVLRHGRDVWEGTCKVCHGAGIAGAPKITGTRFWSKRIEQGLPVLFEHARNGFSGSTGTMPARGGKPELSDADIEAAVRFMVFNSGGHDIALDGLQ
ncbi:MAG: cytochrome c5 family protein [Flavobacteriaceae bacterium]